MTVLAVNRLGDGKFRKNLASKPSSCARIDSNTPGARRVARAIEVSRTQRCSCRRCAVFDGRTAIWNAHIAVL